MEQFRKILSDIERMIIINEGAGATILKQLWNDLSDAVNDIEELPQPEQDAKERYEEAIKSMMPITISPWDFTKIDNALQIASGYNPPKQ